MKIVMHRSMALLIIFDYIVFILCEYYFFFCKLFEREKNENMNFFVTKDSKTKAD